ncbi:MAG TPA: ATP-grasp domain-containing protein [Verrucomicrobiae bacterium]
MPTLLLSSRQTDDTQKLWRACISEEWKIERVHGWKVPEISNKHVAVYGESLFGKHVAKTLGFTLLEPSIDWLPKLPAQYRGRDVRLMTLAEARSVRERNFFKPADEKCFSPRVYEHGGQLPAEGLLPEELPVLVQGVVQWTVEYRCFVLNRRILTASAYWRHDALAKDAEGYWDSPAEEHAAAVQFCESVLRDSTVEIPYAIVIDVGYIADQGWAVVEANAAWASGLYGCDPAQVLKVLLGCVHD